MRRRLSGSRPGALATGRAAENYRDQNEGVVSRKLVCSDAGCAFERERL